jgi:hypothetical protein
MTLKEKFETKSSIDTTKEAKVFASECEKIADEFAIGFAEWVECSKTYYTPMNELLEIYKREKEL